MTCRVKMNDGAIHGPEFRGFLLGGSRTAHDNNEIFSHQSLSVLGTANYNARVISRMREKTLAMLSFNTPSLALTPKPSLSDYACD
jgi:hypothetical protein